MTRRRIEEDKDAAAALARKTELSWMMNDGLPVRVTNPLGETWTGRIAGLADHPVMLFDREDGRRVMLPQCFAVEQVPDGEQVNDGLPRGGPAAWDDLCARVQAAATAAKAAGNEVRRRAMLDVLILMDQAAESAHD